MRDVNGWMLALSFLLGLLLTFAMMIRRVTREVPIGTATATKAAPAKVVTAPAKNIVEKPKVAEKVVKAEKKVAAKVEDVKKVVEKDVKKVVEKVENADVIEAAPYGAGSIRVTSRKVGPAGYTIKGDQDTGRYFTLDSPEYTSIEAEVWFANEESAAKAGFLRWDAKGDTRPSGPVPAQAATVVSETDSSADSSIVIVDDGVPETKIVIVDDGIPETPMRIIGGDTTS